jgi:hypothetical protein
LNRSVHTDPLKRQCNVYGVGGTVCTGTLPEKDSNSTTVVMRGSTGLFCYR